MGTQSVMIYTREEGGEYKMGRTVAINLPTTATKAKYSAEVVSWMWSVAKKSKGQRHVKEHQNPDSSCCRLIIQKSSSTQMVLAIFSLSQVPVFRV